MRWYCLLAFFFLRPVLPPGINTYFFESIDGKAFDFKPPNFSFWVIYLKLPGMFFLLSGHDLAPFAPYPEPMNAQKIGITGTMEEVHRPAGVSVLVADIFKARALSKDWTRVACRSIRRIA